MSLSAIVFSRDRAAQLDQLLSSMYRYGRDSAAYAINVLYKATDVQFERGYERVASFHPEVRFAKETDAPLNRQLTALIDANPREFFAFFVDDDVLLRDFSTDDREFQRLRTEPDLLALSLRLHRGVVWCQPMDWITRPPFMRRGRTWRVPPRASATYVRRAWAHYSKCPRGDWEVRFSVDGNVFLTERFRRHLDSVPVFQHITRIEPELQASEPWADRMLCYAAPRLVNLAFNRVDELHRYPSGDVSPEELNRRFLAGERLAFSYLENQRFRSCHLVRDPVWR